MEAAAGIAISAPSTPQSAPPAATEIIATPAGTDTARAIIRGEIRYASTCKYRKYATANHSARLQPWVSRISEVKISAITPPTSGMNARIMTTKAINCGKLKPTNSIIKNATTAFRTATRA